MMKSIVRSVFLFFAFTGAAMLQATELGLTVDMEQPVLYAGQRQVTYLKVGLSGFEWKHNEARPPLNVSLVLDRSGSMEGDKLERAKEAARTAIGFLSPRDILSIITYETEVQVLLPATRVTDKERILRAIDRIESDGSTALFAGVSKAAHELRKFITKERVNRVILLSDGLANVGPDSTDELVDLGSSLRREGISVTTIGLGLDYNEDLMAGLAQASDGNHAFVQEPSDLIRVFNLEFKDACEVVAQDVELKISCAPGVNPLRVLNHEGEIRNGQIVLNLNNVYSLQDRYFLIEVEIPPITEGRSLKVAEVKVDYLNMSNTKRTTVFGLASARSSVDKKEIAAKRNKDVAEKVAVQKSVMASEEAVGLRDRGDTAGAQAVLQRSAADLGNLANELDSSVLKAASSKEATDAASIKDELNWDAKRKSMVDDQYETKNQQRY